MAADLGEDMGEDQGEDLVEALKEDMAVVQVEDMVVDLKEDMVVDLDTGDNLYQWITIPANLAYDGFACFEMCILVCGL